MHFRNSGFLTWLIYGDALYSNLIWNDRFINIYIYFFKSWKADYTFDRIQKFTPKIFSPPGKEETLFNRKYSFDINDRIRARVFGAIPKQNIAEFLEPKTETTLPDPKSGAIKSSEKIDASVEYEQVLKDSASSGLVFEKINQADIVDSEKINQSDVVENVESGEKSDGFANEVASDKSNDSGADKNLDSNLEELENLSEFGDDEGSNSSNICNQNVSFNSISDIQFGPENDDGTGVNDVAQGWDLQEAVGAVSSTVNLEESNNNRVS